MKRTIQVRISRGERQFVAKRLDLPLVPWQALWMNWLSTSATLSGSIFRAKTWLRSVSPVTGLFSALWNLTS